jgi:glycosyltransferase involved in cell wall biosynthesis
MTSRILHVVGDGSEGGGTTVVLQLAQDLSAQGVPVGVAGPIGSYLLEEASRHGIPILGLDFRTRGGSPRVAYALACHLHATPGTIVHAHGARAGLPTALLPAALRAAFIYTVHGFHFPHKLPGVRHLAMAAERLCMQRAAAIVFVSHSDEGIARGAKLVPHSAETHVIYNGASPAAPAAEDPVFDIAFLGRLHFQKNPEILPHILLALRPRLSTLCIIGSGELEPTLRAHVAAAGLEGQVSFLGRQPHADALGCLVRARLMLLPSRWEGLPVSVVEAMHRGIPVVASDVAGTREVVVDGETGYLVSADDVQGYATRIRHLLEDDEARRVMGVRASARARSCFSIAAQLDAHVALYARVAGAANGTLRQ